MQVLSFKSPVDFRHWLEINNAEAKGVWLRFFKKASGEQSLNHAEALDQALCYGWIDGQAKPYDERSWLQKFNPRRPRSGWSKMNTQHVERLTKAGAMTSAGREAVKAAQRDGRWKAAYDSPRNANPPEDFLKELAKNKKAKVFRDTEQSERLFDCVSSSNGEKAGNPRTANEDDPWNDGAK